MNLLSWWVEKLTICLSAQLLWWRANTQNVIFLNLISSIDNTKLSTRRYTLLPRQHHSFFRNLPPLFTIIKSQLELKKTKTTTKTTMIHKGWPNVTLMISGTMHGDNTHTTHQQILQNAQFVLLTFTNNSKKCIDL